MSTDAHTLADVDNLIATKMDMGWIVGVALKFVGDYHKSIAHHPDIATGAEFTGYERSAGDERGATPWTPVGSARRRPIRPFQDGLMNKLREVTGLALF